MFQANSLKLRALFIFNLSQRSLIRCQELQDTYNFKHEELILEDILALRYATMRPTKNCCLRVEELWQMYIENCKIWSKEVSKKNEHYISMSMFAVRCLYQG